MAMDFFRLLADMCHLSSILILIYKVHTRKTTAGISLRTRVLYLFVFLARYGDLFLYFISVYNTFMKILYLSATLYIIYLMTISQEYKNTWYHDLDNFSILPLVLLSVVLSLICTSNYALFEILWTFSIILESVAILPQIDHLTKVPTLPALPLTHLVLLGLYRFFYLIHWLVRLFTLGVWDLTIFFFGLVQTLIWADLLWVWYNRKQIKLGPNTAGARSQGLRSVEEGHGGGVVLGSQTVDESDLSSSLVLTHLISLTRLFEDRVLGGQKIPGLSVSAYPEQPFSHRSTVAERVEYQSDQDDDTAARPVDASNQGRQEAAHSTLGATQSIGLGDPVQSEWEANLDPERLATMAKDDTQAGSEDGFSVASEQLASPPTRATT